MNFFLSFFLLFWWAMQIFYKLTGLRDGGSALLEKAAGIKNKYLGDFIYSLLQCELCMESHLGALLALPLAYYMEQPELFFFGYMSAGLSHIIKTK